MHTFYTYTVHHRNHSPRANTEHLKCGWCNGETEVLILSNFNQLKYKQPGTSLVAQWLRIRLPMQGARVRALSREDPTCYGAVKPVRHNY